MVTGNRERIRVGRTRLCQDEFRARKRVPVAVTGNLDPQ